nr:putative ribonuclease H-like domain-containing protein [Tanacetum cinerariifolium]
CHVMILNTLDNLGKFKAKGDKGYFIRYSMSSKAFRVFNKRTKKVEENLHVEFLENKAIEKGAGPNWLFDIDSLTKSMNYVPVDAVETLIPTVSSPILNACFTNSLKPSSDARLISKRVANHVETPSPDNILTLANQFEDILGIATNSDESNGVEADVSNMETTITASPTPTLRIHKDHPKSQIIGLVDTLIQTGNKFKEISDALQDPSWVEAMQEELLQFKIQNVWTLVDCPKGEEGIDYDEVFAPVARIEAIRLFLAYASFMRFTVYQMDVKSAFLYGIIDEEVYVMQPLGFQDPEFPTKVYKVKKAMYGLHQAPRAWYDVRSSNTPMDKENPWGKDRTGKDVDLHLYRSMIGSLMYLTASSPDIMFDVFACARHQMTPKECHLHSVKRNFRYLKGHPKLGIWYPKEYPFELVAYSDSDYGVKNPVYHSKTKHIEIRHHFIRDCFEKKLINVDHIHTDKNIADVLTKPFDAGRFQYLV